MRRAFSLVEVMIAMGLSLVIILTVYAGFRVTTQTVIACNRLSIENRIITAGFARCLDEIDFWSSMDRPGHQPLRVKPTKAVTGAAGCATSGADAGSFGQPFTAFTDAWTTPLNENDPAQTGTPNAWDPAWLPHDPKTWYRGDGWLYLKSPNSTAVDASIWGDYALLSGSRATVDHRATGSAPVGAGTPAEATWLAVQQKGLKAALAYYGWWEYLPANAVLDWYDRRGSRPYQPWELANRWEHSPNNGLDAGGNYLPNPVQNIGRFGRWMGGAFMTMNMLPSTRSSFLWEQSLGVCAPLAGDPNPVATLALNRWMPRARWMHWEWELPFNVLLNNLARPAPLIASAPAGWPAVTWDVRRYRAFARTINHCWVRVFDPLTTRMVEVEFRTVGTTLRGARQQRGLDLP